MGQWNSVVWFLLAFIGRLLGLKEYLWFSDTEIYKKYRIYHKCHCWEASCMKSWIQLSQIHIYNHAPFFFTRITIFWNRSIIKICWSNWWHHDIGDSFCCWLLMWGQQHRCHQHPCSKKVIENTHSPSWTAHFLILSPWYILYRQDI